MTQSYMGYFTPPGQLPQSRAGQVPRVEVREVWAALQFAGGFFLVS